MTFVLAAGNFPLLKLDYYTGEPNMTKWMSPSQLPPVRDIHPNKMMKRTKYDWLSINNGSVQMPLRAAIEPISDMATASYMKLASGAENIKVWDSSSYVVSCNFSPHVSSIRSLHWSSDCLNLVSVPKDGRTVVTTYVRKTDLHSLEINTGITNTYARFANTSPQILAIGADSGTIHVWNTKTQKPKIVFKKHSNEVTCLQFNWNDSYIASASSKGDVVLHSTLTNQEHMLTSSQQSEPIRGLQYNYVKKSLLGTVSDSGVLSLWDVNEMKLLHSFQGSHVGPTSGLAFSPVNNVLIASVGLDKRLVCYDAQLKSLIRTFRTEAPLTSVDFMDDGITLAVGSNKGKVYIYDLRSSCVPIKTLAAHTSSVSCISFQHTAHNLASKACISSKKVQQQLIKEAFTQDSLNQRKTAFGNKDLNSNVSERTFEDNICELDSVFSPLGSHEVSESIRNFRRQPIGGGCQTSLSVISNSNAVEDSMPPSAELIQGASLQKFYSPFSEELRNPPSKPEKNIDMQLFDLNIDDVQISTTSSSGGCISPLSPVPIIRQPEIPGAWGDGRQYLSKSESIGKENDCSSKTNVIGSTSNQHSECDRIEIDSAANDNESKMEMDSLGIKENRHLITASLKEHVKTTIQNTFKSQIKQIIQDSFKEQVQQEIHELLKKCVQQVVDDSVEELHDILHREHIQLQSEMVRQFQIQLMEIQDLLKQTLLHEQQLIAEVERLKIENERLKIIY